VSPTPIILDVDTGVDDTLAILYAALHPAVEVVAAGAVWGNVEVETAARNTAHALAMAGLPDVPVAVGAARPLIGRDPVYAHHVHGDDGQGNAGDAGYTATFAPVTAAEQIVACARARPREIELVAVGPLTNLALALGLCAELPGLVRGVTVMGGAALAPGNVTPTAEANIWCDPEAAHAVFAADWPLTVVPLDVTMRTLLTEDDRQTLLAAGGIAGYVGRKLDFYFDFFAAEAFGERRSCMHDVLAVAVACGTLVPTLMPTVRAEVDTGPGPGFGQTVFDLRGRYQGFPQQEGAHCRVVLDCDTDFAGPVVALLCAAGESRIAHV
jgi:inosine-uridine nucleoside N-ribohydrolase